MKKLYLFMIAIFAAIAANATLPDKLYFSQGDNWDTATEMTKKADGIFEIDATFTNGQNNRYFLFRDYLGNMDWNNSKNYGAASKDLQANLGNNTITTNSNNCFCSSVYGDCVIKVDLSTNKFTITKSTVTPTPATVTYGIIYGEDGKDGWIKAPMTERDGKYVVSVSIPADNCFHIYKEDNGSTSYIGADNSDTYWVNSLPAENLKAKSGYINWKVCYGAVNATYTYSPTANTLSITATAGYPDLVLYCTNVNTSTSAADFTKSSTDGKYVWEVPSIKAGSEVQLWVAGSTIGATDDENYRYGAGGSVSLNRWVTLYHKGGSTRIPRELKNVTISANLVNSTIKIAGTRVIDPNNVIPLGTDSLVFFNAGADFFNKDVMNEGKIYAVFIPKANSGSATPDENTKVEMKDIREYDANTILPIFFAKVPGNKVKDYVGVEFRTTDQSGTTHKFNSKKFTTQTVYGDDDAGYDEENWWRYIYGCGLSTSRTNESAADQSFITYEEYTQRRDGDKTSVFFVGQSHITTHFEDDNGYPQSITLDWSPEKGWPEANDDNAANHVGRAIKRGKVYFGTFTFSKQEDARFKMSWIDANTRLANYNSSDGRKEKHKVEKGSQRWWATFNLGIVGPTLPPGYTEDEALAEGYLADGLNKGVAFIIPRCREYSRYDQRDWFIKKNQIPTDGGELTVAIDTEFKTAALLDFKPLPTIKVNKINGSTDANAAADLTTTVKSVPAEYQESFGADLLGSATAGTAKIKDVNSVSGSAMVVASKTDFFARDYELSYQIYSGNKMIAEFDAVPNAKSYKLTINNLAFGEKLPLSCRAFYHDMKNDTHFRSLYSSETLITQITLEKPTDISYDDTKKVIFKDKDGWHAQVEVTFKLPTSVTADNGCTPLSVYPDFSIAETSPCGTEVNLAKTGDFQVENGLAPAHDESDKGDWVEASKVNDTYRLRLVFRNILPAEKEWKDVSGNGGNNYQLDANIIAQYPFYIDYDNDCTVTAYSDEDGKNQITTQVKARRKANGADEGRATGQAVVMSPLMETATTTVSSADLSGIIDAEMFGGEVELYNLQGIRVVGDPAPGIYLRRCGDKVTKVVVR